MSDFGGKADIQVATSRRINLRLVDAPKEEGEYD